MTVTNLKFEASYFEQEERNGYLVSPEMKAVWAVELDLLNEFSKFCEKHRLKWFAHAGTMLGAVRHQGFIPWDDDIDVVMPRKDYDVLCNAAETEFIYPYFLQNEDSDSFYCKNFSKLINLQTTCIEAGDSFLPTHHGIFIDIFPYDNVPDDKQERELQFELLTQYHTEAWLYRNIVHFYEYSNAPDALTRMKRLVKHLFYKYVDKNKGDYHLYMKRHLDLATKYNESNTRAVGELIIPPLGRHIWNREWLDSAVFFPFEMLKVPVPIGYAYCLEVSFGKDWQVPKQVASMHGGMTFDVDRSYEEFKEKQHV